MSDYGDFITAKALSVQPVGFTPTKGRRMNQILAFIGTYPALAPWLFVAVVVAIAGIVAGLLELHSAPEEK